MLLFTTPIYIYNIVLYWTLYCNMKPGRFPHEAVDLFDFTICGTSFYGEGDWVIPSPKMSFARQTDINRTIRNTLAVQYMSNIHNQASRHLYEVANEMNLIQRMIDKGHDPRYAPERLAQAINQLQRSNVFLSRWVCPSFPFPSPIYELSFLRLVFDIKCHLISMAFTELFQQKYGYPSVVAELSEEGTIEKYLSLHNMLIEQFVGRYEKYTGRGITINGIPDFVNYKESGVLEKVDDLVGMSSGMSLFIRPDYFYHVDSSYDDHLEIDPNVFYEDGNASLLLDAQLDLARWLDLHYPDLV